MATNQVLRVDGTQFLFADVTDFPSAGAGPPTTAANDIRVVTPTPTKVQIDCTALAAAAGRQSDQLDLGTPRADLFMVEACTEHATAPTAGGTVDFYWNSSPSATAATGNKGGASGSDAAYTEGSGEEDQLIIIGSLNLINNVINIGSVGVFSPPHRYGSLIVINNGSTAFHATVMDETHITITPKIPDIAAAA